MLYRHTNALSPSRESLQELVIKQQEKELTEIGVVKALVLQGTGIRPGSRQLHDAQSPVACLGRTMDEWRCGLLCFNAVWTCRWLPTYKSTRRHNPEDHHRHIHSRENPRSRGMRKVMNPDFII